MGYRLLIDLEVIAILDFHPQKSEIATSRPLREAAFDAGAISDCHEYDGIGRRIEVSIFDGHSVHYWIDFPDRHVKVLADQPADR